MNKRPYRRHLQVIADVLSVASAGARKTHIMYRANLSYKLLNRYLSEVLDAGFVRQGDDGWYEITEDGRDFLKILNRYVEDSERIAKSVKKVERKREGLEALLSS